VGADLEEVAAEGVGACRGDVAPDSFGGAVVVGEDLGEELLAGWGEGDAPGAAVGGVGVTGEEVAPFEAVDDAGDVGAVGDELAAEVGLGEAFGVVVEEFKDVELAGGEVPGGEEGAADVPEGFGGMEEIEQGGEAGAGGQVRGFGLCGHGNCLARHCCDVNRMRTCQGLWLA
jgi:hypothetical protein